MPPQNRILSSTVTLNNGIAMPRLHLGVYMTSGRECSSAVTHALQAGYRAVDSAEWYANEREVGGAITAFIKSSSESKSQSESKASSETGTATVTATTISREDIWFTTKLQSNVGYAQTRRKIRQSIERSGLGYVDLYLLHSPYGGRAKRLECWRAVEDAVAEGEVRCAGVSNYGVKHLKELLSSNPRLRPAVNQIEVHPFNTQTAITSFCAANDILVEAYAPLARAMRARHPTITQLAGKYQCTWAQLMVRWSLQKGYVPLPKSVDEQRIRANADVDGFVIEEADVRVLDGLDEHLVTDWDPTDAD